MTISKSNLIKLIQNKYNDKETQYNIYKIIKCKCPDSIKNNNGKIEIEMARIDSKTLYEIKKFLDIKDKSQNYENNIEKEINDLKEKMEVLDIHKGVNKLKENINMEIDTTYDYDKSLKDNWKKFWKSDYKGNIDNICEEHVRNIKYYKFKNKRWNEILKRKKHYKSTKMYANRKGETGFEESECINQNEEFINENEFEDFEPIEDTEDNKDIDPIEDNELKEEEEENINTENDTENEIEIGLNDKKQINKLLFGESDTDDSEDEI